VRDGHVRFSYTVDAEAHYDGLSFFVNHQKVFGPVSQQHEFREVLMELPAGHNLLQWVFSKDLSRSTGLDVAAIEVRLSSASPTRPHSFLSCSAADTPSRWWR
jgi:hypothetical protein